MVKRILLLTSIICCASRSSLFTIFAAALPSATFAADDNNDDSVPSEFEIQEHYGQQRFQKVVYGQDDRKDVCQSDNDMLVEIARQSIVAIMDYTHLGSPDSKGSYTPRLSTYRPIGSRRNLCSDQKFRSQPTAASCSGTLIAPDRVLTAGHCVSKSNCGRRRFVFGYYLDGDGCSMPDITADDVYRCKRFTRYETDQVDHAVIQLDRPVVGRTPAKIAKSKDEAPVSQGDHLQIVGFGSGLPAKLDAGGYVIDPRTSVNDYFVANTDTFGGNSGSGVFNDAGTIVGILVRGQVDYVTRHGCRRVNVIGCSDDKCSKLHDAEEISYAWRAYQAMPDCKVNSDCPSGKSCKRGCPASSDACTGWCE